MYYGEKMRLDKFLKNARIIKRRTVSKAACDGGRVKVNGQSAKAGTQLKVGDIIALSYGESIQKYEVLELLEHVPKDRATDLYKEI